MTAKEKCIAKWEKRIIQEENIAVKYSNSWSIFCPTKEKIIIMKEFLKDFNRFSPAPKSNTK